MLTLSDNYKVDSSSTDPFHKEPEDQASTTQIKLFKCIWEEDKMASISSRLRPSSNNFRINSNSCRD